MEEQPSISKHEQFVDIKSRHVAEDVTAEEINGEYQRLLKELQLTPVEEFDTAAKTEGKKVVTLCRNTAGDTIILRIGECQANWFFPNGYDGDYIRIPKTIASGGERIPYEIEEYIPGTMIIDDQEEKKWSQRGQTSPETWNKLLPAFWEFQKIGAGLPMEHFNQRVRVHQFLDIADTLVPDEAKTLVDKYGSFWGDTYPAKWKFATDNLMVDSDGKVVFIDNANVSGRFFAFDIGWIIWPRWVEMETEYFSDVEGQLAYLQEVKKRFIDSAPSDVRVPENIEQAFDLMLFEKCIACLLDVKREVRHFADWGMAGEEGKARREAHAAFIQALLRDVMSRL